MLLCLTYYLYLHVSCCVYFVLLVEFIKEAMKITQKMEKKIIKLVRAETYHIL